MSMSAALSAVRATGRQHLSASKYVARQATGSHVFQIDTYAHVRRMMANGEAMRSDKFTVGGHDWRVECYPNGCQEHAGFLSLFLNHASHAKTGDAMAKFRFSILGQAWKPSYIYNSSAIEGHRFSDATGLSRGWKEFIKHEDLNKAEKYLKDDCLTVVCDVTFTGLSLDCHTEVDVPASPPFDLRGSLGEVIWNKQKPDMKIVAGGVTFAAHRWVLEARSPVFKQDLSLASAAAELRIDDMDADVCKAVLQFIYTDKLDMHLPRFIYRKILGTHSLQAAGMAERLLVAADRYKLEKMKHICQTALLPTIRLSSVAATLALAERHRCPDLKKACIQFLSSPGNLKALVETDSFEKMKMDCPLCSAGPACETHGKTNVVGRCNVPSRVLLILRFLKKQISNGET